MFLRNNYYNVALILLFIFILLLPSIDNIFGFSKNFEFNLKENRRLYEMPSIRKDNGEIGGGSIKRFPKKFEKYYNDHFGFRNVAIKVGSKVLRSTSAGNKGFVMGQNGWMFRNTEVNNDILGVMPLQQYQVDRIVEYFYKNWQYLKGQNIDYVFVLIPVKQSVYPEFLPKYMASVIKKSKSIVTGTDQIVNELKSRYPDFPILDLRKILIENKKLSADRILYHQTDTHWNGLGVKYGYEAIYEYLVDNDIKVNKTGIKSKEEYTIKGDLAEMSGFYPEYLTTFSKPIKPSYQKVKAPIVIDKIRDSIRSYYEIETGVELSQYFNKSLKKKSKVYIQHDSFLRHAYDMHYLLANSFSDSLFFYNPMRSNRVCQLYEKNIEHYKPNLVIHEVVERDLIRYCNK